MANRRMFSLRVINSARFLKMPISSQALYFHLGLNADDDGVVEAYNVIKMCGCTEDDLRVLVGKGFVQVLNEDLVSYVTDWKENNKIRPDRKIDSIYKDLLISIIPDIELIEKRQRKDVKKHKKEENGQPMDNQWTTNGQPMDSIGQVRLGKDRIGSSSTENFPTLEEIQKYCTERKNKIDPKFFFDYYSEREWKISGEDIKDWKAVLRKWEEGKKNTPKRSEALNNALNQFYEDIENGAN